jgi:DNA-binding NarL/FixJ family response regulator
MKHILVISDNDLLMVGIERLIKRAANLSMQKIGSRDEKDILQHILETTPEVVIMDSSFEKSGSLQFQLLLNSLNQLRLWVIQVDSNRIQTYDKREIILENPVDLTVYI